MLHYLLISLFVLIMNPVCFLFVRWYCLSLSFDVLLTLVDILIWASAAFLLCIWAFLTFCSVYLSYLCTSSLSSDSLPSHFGIFFLFERFRSMQCPFLTFRDLFDEVSVWKLGIEIDSVLVSMVDFELLRFDFSFSKGHLSKCFRR